MLQRLGDALCEIQGLSFTLQIQCGAEVLLFCEEKRWTDIGIELFFEH